MAYNSKLEISFNVLKISLHVLFACMVSGAKLAAIFVLQEKEHLT